MYAAHRMVVFDRRRRHRHHHCYHTRSSACIASIEITVMKTPVASARDIGLWVFGLAYRLTLISQYCRTCRVPTGAVALLLSAATTAASAESWMEIRRRVVSC